MTITFNSIRFGIVEEPDALVNSRLAGSELSLGGKSVNSEQYFAIRAEFLKRSNTEDSATTMALALLEVASLSNVNAMSLLDILLRDAGATLDFETLVAMDFLRIPQAKHGTLKINNNKKSPRNRNVIT